MTAPDLFTGDRTTARAQAEVQTILDAAELDPLEVHIKGHHADPDPIATVTLRSVADLEAFTARDGKPTITRRHVAWGTTGRHWEHSATYDRPGRKMLALARIFAHMDEWTDQ
ncbi:hypothetical protein [Pseudactinotalea sp. Z1732]|uniref:hypothetical protein n=1 Tax=Micrococcales TaxID=85006 RepID=UPI003C7C8FDD